MKKALYNYDVYPKVFLQNREKEITVQPLGLHSSFKEGHAYTVRIFKVNQANPSKYPERSGRTSLEVTPNECGNLVFTAFGLICIFGICKCLYCRFIITVIALWMFFISTLSQPFCHSPSRVQ